jgi:hypothetical protein
VLDKGTTFIFGSWICVANSLGGFNGHLADSRKPEASTPTRCSNLDKFVDSLDELLLPDHVGEIEMTSVFDATSTRSALGLLGSNSNRFEEATQSKYLSDLEEGLDRLLKIRDEGVLSVKTHRRAATGNTRSREAPGTAGGPRSLGQRPRIRHTT